MTPAEKKRETYRRWYARNRDTGKARSAAYRKANPDKVMSYNHKNSKFTFALFTVAIDMQNSCCAICLVPFSTLPKRSIHADHDHTTGRPRGVLCQKCNHGLGLFKDDPGILVSAIRYLKEPTL